MKDYADKIRFGSFVPFDADKMKSIEIKKTIFNTADTLFSDTPVLFAYMYGSYAADQSHPFSDLDIAIYVPASLSRKERMDLEMVLALKIDKRLVNGPESDVRIINYLPLVVAGEIVTEGILIFCRDDEARIDYETMTRCAYFDFIPFLRSYQRTYLEQIAAESD